jgi:spore germination cell wall hydrolase CwlJ-like protein
LTEYALRCVWGCGVMVASRVRVLRASGSARFWLSAFCISLMPTSVGYQDLAALIAHRPHVYASFGGEHLIASPLGTIERAAFNFTRPVGTVISPPFELQNVSFDPRSLDAYAWKVDETLTGRAVRQVEYPTVNRTHKGDRLPPAAPAAVDAKTLPQLQPIDAPAAPPPAAPVVAPAIAPQAVHAAVHAEGNDAAPHAAQDTTQDAAAAVQMDAVNPASAPQARSLAAIAHANPATSVATPSRRDDAGNGIAPRSAIALDRSNVPGGGDAAAAIADQPPEIPQAGAMQSGGMTIAQSNFGESFIGGGAADHSAQVYFGGSVMGAPATLQSWAPGAEPILVTPPGASVKMASLEDTDNDEYGGDETVTGKDESRVLSPAQRLGLSGPARAEAQKCLADAIYFEARGEVMKGQEAVAQVVMNRVFSGYYPHDVCGVVYQNAHHHLACQFTFACEGKDLNKIDEPDMWEQAKRIARDTLDGKIWLAEVGHATHYHAYWVHPSWVHEMTRLYRLGVHTFYRPRNWGDGDDAPMWGPNAPPTEVTVDPASKAEYLRPDPEVLSENPVPNPAAAVASMKGPQASAVPAQDADQPARTAKL